MNKTFNKAKAPVFQQPKDSKRFNEHKECFSEGRQENRRGEYSDRFNDKFNDKKDRFNHEKLRFKQKNEKSDRTFRSDRNERSNNKARNIEKSLRVSETTMRAASGKENAVKVIVKGSYENTEKVKKTGALSPRAPEKIKKNRAEEMKVYGEAACLALFAQRPESIVRAWTTVEMSHKVGALFSYLAANKKAYHVVDRAELELVSGAEHHGGICMLVKKQRPFTLTGYLDIVRQEDALVLLDGVNNPQNLGSIVRTCAFYGMKNIVLTDVELFNSAAAMRVAEGGMEYIHALQTESTEYALDQLRQAGYQIVRISNHKQAPTLAKVRLENKIVFVLSEIIEQDLSAQDTLVSLSPVNPLKNGLNVAVNAGVLLSHWYFK